MNNEITPATDEEVDSWRHSGECQEWHDSCKLVSRIDQLKRDNDHLHLANQGIHHYCGCSEQQPCLRCELFDQTEETGSVIDKLNIALDEIANLKSFGLVAMQFVHCLSDIQKIYGKCIVCKHVLPLHYSGCAVSEADEFIKNVGDTFK